MKTVNSERQSLYNVLGVSPTAGQSQIKSAYKSLLTGMGADDAVISAKRAYQVLSDKNMRMRYDNALASQAGFDNSENRPEVAGGPGMVTVYTIDRHGNWYTEKRQREKLPDFDGSGVYAISIGDENVSIIPKGLWNKWRDLCEIWRSRDVIKDTIGNVSLNVDLISLKNGRLAYSKIQKKVSQLPPMFPNAVNEKGEVYAYRDEMGETVIIEEYDYVQLRRLMERQSRSYEQIGW